MKTLTKIYWLRFALGFIAAMLCIGYGYATGTISTNLVLNNSVETGTSTPQDWYSSGAGAKWSTTTARTGLKSVEINVANDSAEWKGSAKPAKGDATYQIQAYFKGNVTTENQFYLEIKWLSDSGSTLDEKDVPIPLGNYSQWLQLSRDFTAPKETKNCEIIFRVANGTGTVCGDDFEVRQTESITKLLNGISISTITFLVSYYIIKFKFRSKVENLRKLFTTGIGIYFLSWLVFWIMLYTIIGVYL